MSRALTRRDYLRSCGVALGAALIPSARPALGDAAVDELDLVLRGGRVFDGTGGPSKLTDLGVKGDRITTIGDLKDVRATRTLDVSGLCVAPGFIDMHSHSDRSLLVDGLAQSGVRQGVTTHVTGNCGSSPAPNRPGTKDTFVTFQSFIAALRKEKTSINVCPLVGHNSVRVAVMGQENRRPTPVELDAMRELVDEAMKSGAVGMSTGLVSPPGTYSETPEIVELAKVVAKHGGLYASHMRGEASTVIAAVQEALQIGHEAAIRVQISHHKAVGKENWGKTRHTLAIIEEAARSGVKVHLDVYPYRAGSAGLSQLVPPWAHEGGRDTMLERLRDPQVRPRIARDMSKGLPDWPNFFEIDWDDIQIASVSTDANRRWVGHKVGDVARARNIPGVEACIDLLIEERSGVQMINFVIDEEEMRRVLAHPLSMIGSDGVAVSPDSEKGQPHPRFYGCFPRVLGRYVRELKVLSLETAVHKMTGMPAAQLGLRDRGQIRIGMAADLAVFDAAQVADRATFESPHQYPVGIPHVIVGGQLVIHDGQHTGARPGRVGRLEEA